MKIQNKRIREVNVPYKLIFKNQIHEITDLHDKFILRDFTIKTVDGKIDTVKVYNPHPNADPRSGDFCIPHTLRQLEVSENTLNMIRSMLCCFNLDNCYFTPWDEIKYEKQEVSGAWKKK